MLRSSSVSLFAVLAVLANASNAQQPREVYEGDVEAGVEQVWNAFATTDGLRSWTYPDAEVDLKLGGKWKTADTVEHTILCYDPNRMLSVKATRLPKEFRFADAAKELWVVFYFSPVHDARTRITVVGLGYTDTDQSKLLRSLFAGTHAYTLEKLREAMKKGAAP